MRARIPIIALLLSIITGSSAQHDPFFPKSVVTGQFAGSTGLVSAGFSKVTPHDRIELGLLYGFLPKAYGGTNHSLSLKFVYNPFRFRILKRIWMEPVQLGAFVCQNFNKDIGPLWGKNYPPNYYWWPRGTRFHPTLSTQIAVAIGSNRIDRVACYFEANTNDLYISSYYPNRKALSFYDIVFFGAGLKLYLQ